MKPKTLGEMLAEDNEHIIWHAGGTGPSIKAWLERHGITDATPLMVADMGVLEDVADHGQAVVMAFRADDGLWQHMEDCEGCTVALIAKEKK